MNRHFIHAALAALLLAPPGVLAQDAEDDSDDAVTDRVELEKIQVSARQRSEELFEVPATVTVFTESDIANAGIERPEDLVNLTPGVSLINTAEVGDVQVNIRGINTNRDAETNFALIIDGVLLTNPNAFNQEFADVVQFEVLKGPQGAQYGRNAASGAIIINTRMPERFFESYILGGIGSDSTYTGQAMVGGPIGETAAGKFSAWYRSTDGQFRNTFLNADVVDDLEEQGFSGRITMNSGDATAWDFKATYRDVESAAISFNSSFSIPLLADIFGVPEFYEDVNEHEFFYIANIDSDNQQENLNLSVKMDHELDVGTLTAILAYNDQQNSFIADGASSAFGLYAFEPTCNETFALRSADTPLPPPYFYAGDPASSILPAYSATTCDGYQYQQRDQEDVSFEMRLTSPDDQRLRWQAGIYLLDFEREVVVAQGADLNRPILGQPYNPPSSQSPTDLLYWDVFDTQVWAVFGQVFYDVTEQLELAFALRYDDESRDVSNRVPNVEAPIAGGGGQPINPAYRFADSIPDRSNSYSELQPKVSLNYEVSDEWSLYSTYGRGFRSGGFNSQGSAATIEAFYEPFGALLFNVRDDYDKETLDNIELGFKARLLDNRLALNGAYYHTWVDDMQFFNFFAGPFGLLRVVTNIDEVEIDGLELDFRYIVGAGWRLDGGFSWIDGEIKENRNRPFTVGNELPYAPEYTANLGIQNDMPIGDFDWTNRLDISAVGDTWFHTVQADSTPTLFGLPGEYSTQRRDAYQLVNFRSTVRTDAWRITGWVRNLFDEDYLAEVITAPEFGGAFIHEAPGRSYGIEFQYYFN